MSKEKDIWDMSDDKLVRLAMKTGSDFNADAVLGLGKGPLSQQGISDAVSDKYPYLAPLPASGESSSSSKGSSSSGGSSGSSGDGFSPSKSLGVGSKLYATDDYGGMDYSALLQTAPQYQPSEWDKTRDALTKAALEMNYDDWTKGEQYAALAERYGQQGQQSMRDTLGQVSARTGGLASSYAATAAQQSYNQYMSQLEEVARQMYAGERADAIQNAQLAYQISDRNYQRYLDQRSQYNTDRSFNFGVLSDALDRSFQREQWENTLAQQEYQKERDALSDQRYTDETAYGRGLDAYDQGVALRDDARTRIGQYLTMGGGLDGLDPALIEQSQYTPAELEAIGRYYAPQQQPQQGQYIQQGAPMVGSSGGPAFNNGKLTSEQVKELQTYLRNGGMDIAVDGYWGPASRAASGMSADDAWTYMEEMQDKADAEQYEVSEGALMHVSEKRMAPYIEAVRKRIEAGESSDEIAEWIDRVEALDGLNYAEITALIKYVKGLAP